MTDAYKCPHGRLVFPPSVCETCEVERLTADNVAKQEQLDRFEALADKKIDRLLAEQQRLEGALGLSMAREVRQSAVVEAARDFVNISGDAYLSRPEAEAWNQLNDALAALDCK